MFGYWKSKSTESSEEGNPLQFIGKKSAAMEDVLNEGFKFVASCYGRNEIDSSQNRRAIWMMKADGARKGSNHSGLKSLPPTNEALALNIKRAHFTAILWNESVTGIMPNIDPCDFGWETRNDCLRPLMLPSGVDVAPKEVLEMTRCRCVASKCRTRQCSCIQAGLNCTELCGCCECENKKSSDLEQSDSETEDEEDV